MVSIVQLLQSFNESPLTIEQAERLAAIRQAAAGFAAVVHQALPDSPWRDKALDSIREILMAAREAVAVELASPGIDPTKERRELLGVAAESLTKRQGAALAALLGLLPEETGHRAGKSKKA